MEILKDKDGDSFVISSDYIVQLDCEGDRSEDLHWVHKSALTQETNSGRISISDKDCEVVWAVFDTYNDPIVAWLLK
jgi:hypothetical protein